VAAQYANVTPVEHVYPLVRSQKQLDRVLDEIEEAPASCFSPCWRRSSRPAGSQVPADQHTEPFDHRPGHAIIFSLSRRRHYRTGRRAAHLNAEYFKRIDALNYTMIHDDGQHVEGLEDADVVLVGVSRTSKTPTSIYLANRGIRTANVPLVPGIAIPHQLVELKKRWWSVCTRHRSGSFRFGQNRLLSMGDRTTTPISIVRPSPMKSRSRGD